MTGRTQLIPFRLGVEGAEEGDARPRRGWPPFPKRRACFSIGALSLDCRPRRAQTFGRLQLHVDGTQNEGGDLCRPLSARTQVSQQGRGVSDPAFASQTRPRCRPTGSLTPHMSMSMSGRAL